MNENPQSDTYSLLDLEQIQMLVEAGASDSMELLKELLTMYEEESRQKLDDMKTHADAGDYEALGRAAHALAGSSANVGAKSLWQLAKQVEDHCKQGQGETGATMLGSLESTYTGSIQQLHTYTRSA